MRPLMVVGGIALDITATVDKFVLHTSTYGKIKETLGGVGRNVAEAAQRTGAKVRFVSVVGNDPAGDILVQGMRELGMDTKNIEKISGQSSAIYNAMHSHEGQLIAAVADMNIFDTIDPLKVVSTIEKEKPSFLCFDGNIPSKAMQCISQKCRQLSIPVFFEPTSVPKSLKIFEQENTTVDYISPNQFELEALCERIHSDPILFKKKRPIRQLSALIDAPRLAQSVLPQALDLSNHVPNVFTKLGEEGCLFVSPSTIQYFPPEKANNIQSVTGAGDCFVGTLVANLQKHSVDTHLSAIIQRSQLSAIRTLQSPLAVSPDINHELLL
ncbi:Ribokinase-like protein [Sporodiniella umbellata]|nr:Ribokinase-like protein [Sporodiniella umbellata]